jgi:phosphoglycerol transferase MdoB-like AlkP superfamily enzyme
MAYFFAFGVSFFLTLLLECFFKPVPRLLFKRNKQSLLVTTLLVFSLFLFALFLTQRPYFSASLSLLGFIIVLVVSNTKFKTLREPLVFSDFFLYLQAVKHPRLYLPFLGVMPLVGLVLLVLLIVFSGFYIEPAKYSPLSLDAAGVAVLLLCSFMLLRRIANRIPISADAIEDCRRLGVLATLCCYGTQALDQRASLADSIKKNSSYSSRKKPSDQSSPERLADIVVVQSESFFDARIVTNTIKTTVLSEYDKCLLESNCHGRLKVPAWGANTMRTEFAFLTGLESNMLGLAQYYPYQQLIGMNIPSIVSELKSQGYWCVCIHPNASSFFMRDKFFQQLGFDEFIDADGFTDAKREGPYVSDLAVSEKIKKTLGQIEQPCFIFAITMENHGPLHMESVSAEEWRSYYDQEPSAELTDLTVYLRHLKNADSMIQQQVELYRERSRETVFAFYGDHVPAISDVFEELSYDDPRSNYFIWSRGQLEPNEASTMRVESLGLAVVDLVKSLSK